VMQGVGAGQPYAAVLPFALTVLAVLPLWQGVDQRKARLTVGIAAGLALMLSLWVLLDAPADSVAVYADTKR
jgi:4-amino-4-deoxy-L-arabinose transferase-like glycosyltransferase